MPQSTPISDKGCLTTQAGAGKPVRQQHLTARKTWGRTLLTFSHWANFHECERSMSMGGRVPLPHTLGLVVSSIARKPAVVEDRIEPREILNLTVVFDHDVVDGAPAARFVRPLVALIESGFGLADADQPAHPRTGDRVNGSPYAEPASA